MILVVFALILFGIALGLSVSGLVSLKNHVAPMQVITRQYYFRYTHYDFPLLLSF